MVRTTCPYCGVGCGIVATPDDRGGAEIAGDKDHPANRGRICSKGAALGETLSLEDRLLHPEIDGRRVSWQKALDTVADGFRDIIAEHGPDAVAFYVSGQLLTEDYYAANKLIKGFLGTANIDTNSRLCMASSVAGHKRAFGSDTVPGLYEDFELADLVVLVGSNLAWCHPVLFQRLEAAKRARPGMNIVVIDPRRTDTCEIADLHLALAPGSDVALFNGLLVELHRRGVTAMQYVERHTAGLEEALIAARATDLAQCDLPSANVATFVEWFARAEKTVTLYSQGVNQSSAGVDKVNAIINCHLLTGRIGRPGMGPFSITGQPNAMGGREVGALSNTLAAHMDFTVEDVDRVGRFWRSPGMAKRPGLKAVELFDAVKSGRIKAVWIMATNPVASLPDAEAVRAALKACELSIVSEAVRASDTVDACRIRLPALAWAEKNGTVTNSERGISRQRPFLPAPGEARQDWWILAEVARRLGYGEAFSWTGVADIFREHAALSAFENDGRRDFDIGAHAALDDETYDRLAPFAWPARAGVASGGRFFADGGFFHGDRRARFIATAPRPPMHAPDAERPLRLNTGRVRDQWHTMTRTGKSVRLAGHRPEPLIEMHPSDAIARGLGNGDIAEVTSDWGRAALRVHLTDSLRAGDAFAPMHWTAQVSRAGAINAAVNPAVDPISGQPELKHTPVDIRRLDMRWYGTILARRPVMLPEITYWARARGAGYHTYFLAGAQQRCLPVNVVDRPKLSSFIMPAIVDRSPITIAISTGGAAPALARRLRAEIERAMPAAIGRLARFAEVFREQVRRTLDQPRTRRRFWDRVFEGRIAELALAGDEIGARRELIRLLDGSRRETGPTTGMVHLVGAGPGDPDLLTMKAHRLLQRADVVVYDRLVSTDVLAMARRDAERIYVGKRRANHCLSQDEINQRLVALARAGKSVVRLKGGDPFVFGRGGEEIEALVRAGVAVEVVPGITAALGCAASAGIPLTHRDHAQACVFVTGHLKNGSVDLDWPMLARPRQTVVIYMGANSLSAIASQLVAHGLPSSTPVALIENGTTDRERRVVGTLATIERLALRAHLQGPTLCMVGEVVGLAMAQAGGPQSGEAKAREFHFESRVGL